MRRRSLTLAALAATAVPLSSRRALAQPANPPRIVVPYAPGGVGDMMSRALAERMSPLGGQTILVDNKPGGGTVIGAQAVHAAPADGQQLLMVAASFVINQHLMARLPFDPLRDFVPVSLLASNPHLLIVHPSVPASDLKSLVAWARGRDASYASFGNGSSGHLGFELLKKAADFPMVHVPYKGGAPAIADLIAGQVHAMLTDLPQAVPHVKAGKVKAIALAGPRRAAALPDVPTFAEMGLPSFESRSWYGMVMRSGSPAESVQRWNQALLAALREPEVRSRLEQAGLDIIGTPADEFGGFLRRESARYAEAVRLSGAKIE